MQLSPPDQALVPYGLIPNKLLVREYLTVLPDEKVLAVELEKSRKQLATSPRATVFQSSPFILHNLLSTAWVKSE